MEDFKIIIGWALVGQNQLHYNQREKMEIIRIVEKSEIGVVRTLRELSIHPSVFYKWYNKYKQQGYDGLARKKRNQFWNQIPPWEKQRVVEYALERPDLSPRELAYHITDKYHYFISESSVYRILKRRGLITSPAFIVMSASDKFKNPSQRVNEPPTGCSLQLRPNIISISGKEPRLHLMINRGTIFQAI